MSKTPSTSYPIRLPGEILDRINEASEKTKLKVPDVMRLALERGLPLVEKALGLSGEELARLTETTREAA